MDRSTESYLRVVINNLEKHLDAPCEKSSLAFDAAFGKLFNHLFIKYFDSLNHTDHMDWLINAKEKIIHSDDFPNKLFEIYTQGQDTRFLQYFPFIGEMLVILQLSDELVTVGKDERLINVLTSLKRIIRKETVVPCLLEMQEAVRGFMKNKPVDKDNFRRCLCRFSVQLREDRLSTKIREQEPYNYFNWRIIEILDKKCVDECFEDLSSDHGKMIEGFQSIERFIQQLIEYEEIFFHVSSEPLQVESISVPYLESIARYYLDISFLEYMEKYLSQIDQIKEESLTNRLAIIRIFQVLGEGSKNLSKTLKNNNQLFSDLEDIRDRIIHPKGEHSKERMQILINDSNDSTLLSQCEDLKALQAIVNELLIWRRANKRFDVVDNDLSDMCSGFNSIAFLSGELKQHILPYNRREELRNILLGLKEHRFRSIEESFFDVAGGDVSKKKQLQNKIKLLGLSGKKSKVIYDSFYKRSRILSLKKDVENQKKPDQILEEISKSGLAEEKKCELVRLLEVEPVKYSDVAEKLKSYLAESEAKITEHLSKNNNAKSSFEDDKDLLLNVIVKETKLKSKHEIYAAVDALFYADDEKKRAFKEAVNDIYRVSNNVAQPISETYDKSKSRSMESLYEETIKSIDKMLSISLNINRILSENGLFGHPEKVTDLLANQPKLNSACEYLITTLSKEANRLDRYLESIKDYNNIRNQSLFLDAEYSGIRKTLNNLIRLRKDIAHHNVLYSYHPWSEQFHQGEINWHLRYFAKKSHSFFEDESAFASYLLLYRNSIRNQLRVLKDGSVTSIKPGFQAC